MAHLTTKGHNFRYTFSDEDVVADIKRVIDLCKKDTITAREYNVYGKYHSTTLITRYKTWNNVLKICGLQLNLNRNFTNTDLFEEIERIWIILGRQPTTTDIKKGISKFSLNTYARRFGGWRNALQKFVNYINEDNNENGNILNKQEIFIQNNQTNSFNHKTNRDVNLRLRFKVFQRDNFKCCICGASPAIDSSVQLHVDHIKPRSKGGETVLNNLQTLCSKCNLGKSDLDIKG